MKIDRAICINRDDRPDRWQECQSEFEKLGLQVVRQPAIVTEKPVIGSRLSIARAVESALKDNLSNVLVMEDDVEFIHPERLRDPPTDVPVDLYYLGYVHLHITQATVCGPWIRLERHAGGAHAIVYFAHMFKWIVDMLTTCDIEVTGDQLIAWAIQTRGNVYCTNPPIALQRNSRSNLSPDPNRSRMHDVMLRNYQKYALPIGAFPIEP